MFLTCIYKLTKVESSDKELQDKVESLTKKLDRSEALRNQGDKSGSACSISLWNYCGFACLRIMNYSEKNESWTELDEI